MVLDITDGVSIPLDEITLDNVRAAGPGGQHVNKVATAVQLRFDIDNSSLPDEYKVRLRGRADKRISKDGVVVIKAQRFRSQEQNRADALERLRTLVIGATRPPRRRKPTRPSAASRRRRLELKGRRSKLKALRRNIDA